MVNKVRLLPDESQRTLAGYGYGLHQPILFIGFTLPQNSEFDLVALSNAIGFEWERSGDAGDGSPAETVCHWLLGAIHHVHRLTRLGVFEKGKLVRVQQMEDGSYLCLLALPYLNPTATRRIAGWLLERVSAKKPAQGQHDSKKIETQFHLLQQSLEKNGARGVNMLRILPAALDYEVPFKRLENDYYILGYGAYQRILNSTITDKTTSVGVSLARNKFATGKLLKMAGLPTTAQVRVASEESAVRHAVAMGYPVVIKPVDTDGGKGVYASLADERALRKAYAKAAELQRPLLLEKHVDGADYRINISHGKIIKAIQRMPGGVTGDGEHTIAQLVEIEQNRPWALQRARERGRTLLTLDEEALAILAEAGLSSDAVLEEGVFLALRQRANISTGGTMVDISGYLHPDNAELALGAAQTLGLDLAGIDLLMPDISVSWREGGAVICEVNAQPQISAELAPDIFRQLFADLFPGGSRGRILALLCDDSSRNEAEATAAQAVELLAQAGYIVSRIEADAIHSGCVELPAQKRGFIERAEVALYSKNATASVLVLTDEEVVRFGLPMAYGDCLYVTSPAQSSPLAQNLRRVALEMISPHFETGAGQNLVRSELTALSRGCKSVVEVNNLERHGQSIGQVLVNLLVDNPLGEGPATDADWIARDHK